MEKEDGDVGASRGTPYNNTTSFALFMNFSVVDYNTRRI